jgi:hypothetical protein
MGQQLGAGLVQTHLREPGVVGTSVDLQHILHAPDKLSIGLGWDDPLLPQPGFELVFGRVRRTVSYDRASTYSSSTLQLASRRSVQRPCPSGGLLPARAMSWASCQPSRMRWYWRLGERRCNAAASPSLANRWRTRAMVGRLTSRAAAMSLSFQLGPWSPWSALSKMRAWAKVRAGPVPAEIKSLSCWRCPGLRLTMYRFFMQPGYTLASVPIKSWVTDH